MAGRVWSHERTLDLESYQLICADAQRGTPSRGSMSHTIKDIAQLVVVSTATVSRVVNGFEKVSDETRSRGLALISESHYRPNVKAT